MAWTAEDRRKYAPAIQEVLRRGMLVRLATAIDTIDPPAKVGRPRDWSTLTMLGALWHLARDGCVWRRLPVGPTLPPHQSVWSRFLRWRLRAVLDRALAVLVACRRLAAGRKRRPTAAIVDTQSVRNEIQGEEVPENRIWRSPSIADHHGPCLVELLLLWVRALKPAANEAA